jgi:ADP-heptose:LPS heptosyltransferase
MINREHFVSSRNYYLVSILHYLLWPVYSFSRIFSSNKKPNNKILFVELGHMGDMLTTASIIKLVKQQKPKSLIAVLCSSSAAVALNDNPMVDEVIVMRTPYWYNTTGDKHGETLFSSFRAFLKTISETQADTLVNVRATSYHIDHIAGWLAGSREQIGFGNKGLGYMLTHAGNAPNEMPLPIQKLNLVADWLKLPIDRNSIDPTFFPGANAGAATIQLLEELAIPPGSRVIGINPGAQHNFAWPERNFVALCKLINEQTDCRVLFLGTKNHEEMIGRIQSELPFKTYSAAGKTKLDELFFLLKHLNLLVTIDTGIRHLGNAAKIPVIAIRFGADGYDRYGKYTALETVIMHRVPCAPCGRETCPLPEMVCMTGIQPKEVFESVLKQLRPGDRRPLHESNANE